MLRQPSLVAAGDPTAFIDSPQHSA